MGQQLMRVAGRELALRLRVEKDRIVGNREDARQLVGHHDHGRAQTVAQLEDQVIETARADRVQPGRRLVEEQHLRIERHGARQAGPLAHAAADLGRIVVLEPGKAHQGELERHDLAHFRGAQVGVLAERQRDVLGKRHRAPQGTALVEHAKAMHELLAFLRRGVPEAHAVVEHLAARRLLQADHLAHERALTATAAAHDDENIAAPDCEIQLADQHEAAVGQVHVAHHDVRIRRQRRRWLPGPRRRFRHRGHCRSGSGWPCRSR